MSEMAINLLKWGAYKQSSSGGVTLWTRPRNKKQYKRIARALGARLFIVKSHAIPGTGNLGFSYWMVTEAADALELVLRHGPAEVVSYDQHFKQNETSWVAVSEEL